MNSVIALLLLQDAVTSGAIYALLALTLVLVFSVSRVILIPQGDLVSFAALTLGSMQAGRVPGTIWLLAIGAGLVSLHELYRHWREGRGRSRLKSAFAFAAFVPLSAMLAGSNLAALPFLLQILLTLLIVAPLGAIMYKLAFEPVANASVLVLLVVAVSVHFALAGAGLLLFGPEGVRNPPIFDGRMDFRGIPVSGQAVFVVAVTVVLIICLFLLFEYTVSGKALRATAFNRIGALLIGVSLTNAGLIAFSLAGLIGAISGVLTSSLSTIYYDTGFLMGLKGFVAAIFGGLASYPLAAVGALLVGMLETYSSFWASLFKDVIVFALIIPVLLWRNFGSVVVEEDDE